MELSVNPTDESLSKSILKEKDNEIAHLKKQLNIPVSQLVQIPKLRQAQEENEKIYANLLHFKKLAEKTKK